MSDQIDIDETGVVLGWWVDNSQMHPATNVFGRRWMTIDGELHGTYHGISSLPPEAYLRGFRWFFPAQPDEMASPVKPWWKFWA